MLWPNVFLYYPCSTENIVKAYERHKNVGLVIELHFFAKMLLWLIWFSLEFAYRLWGRRGGMPGMVYIYKKIANFQSSSMPTDSTVSTLYAISPITTYTLEYIWIVVLYTENETGT